MLPTKWVVDEDKSCPECGAAVEVLMKTDFRGKVVERLYFPWAERCTKCDWEDSVRKLVTPFMC